MCHDSSPNKEAQNWIQPKRVQKRWRQTNHKTESEWVLFKIKPTIKMLGSVWVRVDNRDGKVEQIITRR